MKQHDSRENHLTRVNGTTSQSSDLPKGREGKLFPGTQRLTPDNIMENIQTFIQYLDDKFSEEERLMEYYNYSRLDDHRKQHQSLFRKIVSLQRLACLANKADADKELVIELYCQFKDKVAGHIKEWDDSCSVFVQKCTELESRRLRLTDEDFRWAKVVDFNDEKIFPAEPALSGLLNLFGF